MKKYFSFLLAVLLLCTMLPLGAISISAEQYGDLTYSIEDGEVTITDCHFEATEAIIPAEIDGYPVTQIKYEAFYDCRFLASVIIPDSVTSIGFSAFYNCNSLTAVTIPNNVTRISARTFSECDSLASVTIPDSVTIIDEYAFSRCKSLTSVTIPDSVTTIGNGAFYECYSLTSVTVPKSVTTIEERAFAWCDSLLEIIVDEDNANYCDMDGVLYTKNKRQVVQYPGGREGRYIIPDGVTNIGNYAFFRCYSLTSVVLPDGLNIINDFAFQHCTSLTSVTLPKSIKYIYRQVFPYCELLTAIYYGGTEADRANININRLNEELSNITWYYSCINPEDHYSPDVDNSVMDTEDGSGLAYKFEMKLNGLQAIQGNRVDFSNATVNYKGETCKVVAMGAVVSNIENKKMELSDVNGTNTIDIPVIYLQNWETDSCAFAIRVINIPESALDRTIYARPYYVIETKNGTVTVYGKISSASCAEYI